MKKTLYSILFAFLLVPALVQAQQPLHVETHYLSNGLKVILAEDPSEPKIFGSVIVHAGSKNEDTAYTGVAHYFEHMMFKGTDRIGTTDWAKESLYLDSISKAYDLLHDAKSEEERHKIQLEINRLNIEANKYAIANETDAILQKMGCTGLNAGTSCDYTIYYNYLPSNQLENWMDVYTERFRNPVYRLFQGELEAVYEEKNIGENNAMNKFIRTMYTEAFGEHPYSRDVIGYGRHLKNPQPSQMKVFYDKYYVASNMTLLLVGDFNTAQALQMAEERFSIWPRGEKAEQKQYNLPRYEKQVVKKIKQTPLPMGIILFPGVKSNHPDKIALDVTSKLISGGNGLLDELTTNTEIMGAYHIPVSLRDAGVNALLYIPIPIVQRHKSAEKKIFAALDSIREGRFSDALLESIKVQALRERKEKMENLRSIAMLLQTLELEGSTYEEWLQDNERIQNITRQDIMDIASRYFDRKHCTIIRSKMGSPKKESAVKPDWDHLEAQNIGAVSPFAQTIYDRPVKEITPQVIDFNKDVTILDVTPNCKLYAVNNPRNDIFSLNINYHYSVFDNRDLKQALNYFELIGADSLTREEFNIEVERLGGNLEFSTTGDYSQLSISGFEDNLEAIVALVVRKLNSPRIKQAPVDMMVQAMKAEKKGTKDDPDAWQDALLEYAIFGDKSSNLNHMTIEELKQMKGEDLFAMLNPIFNRDGYVTYVGNRNPKEIAQMLVDNKLVRKEVTPMTQHRKKNQKRYNEDKVFYVSNDKFVKSDIYVLVECPEFDLNDVYRSVAYDEYMGGGMNSVFFQEIREFRSLGYSTYTVFSYDKLNRNNPTLMAFLGTQCDKTIEGIDVIMELLGKFPEREAKFNQVRDYLVSMRNGNYINFRKIPGNVRSWMEFEKLTEDPRAKITHQIKEMTYDQLRDFHKQYIEGRPHIIIVSGNSAKYDLNALSKHGKVTEVKYEEMFKF